MPGPRADPQFSAMPVYVAFVRGITATNPNCRNARLVAAIESAGCTDVRPVIASGNFIFRSTRRSPAALEDRLERILAATLDLTTDVILRRHEDLAALVASDPFAGCVHGQEWYLTVTFRKDGQPPVFSKVARAGMDGPALMADLERRLGRHITTRTWNTLLKIRAQTPATPER